MSLPSSQKDRNILQLRGDTLHRSDRDNVPHIAGRACLEDTDPHNCTETTKIRCSVHASVYYLYFMCISVSLFAYVRLTMLQYTQGCMCTPLWRGGRWHCFGIGISAGSCYHRYLARSAPHTSIHGSQLCKCMLLWWGYTVLHFYIDTGYCSEDPSDYCHMLQREETPEIQRSVFQCFCDIN